MYYWVPIKSLVSICYCRFDPLYPVHTPASPRRQGKQKQKQTNAISFLTQTAFVRKHCSIPEGHWLHPEDTFPRKSSPHRNYACVFMATEQSVKVASFPWSWAISGVNKNEVSPVQRWAGRPAWVILTQRLIWCDVGMTAMVCLWSQEFQCGQRGWYPGVLMTVHIRLWVGKPEQEAWVEGVFFFPFCF